MNGQDANTALQEVRARFAALKTLSGLQARLLAAFQEKNTTDGLKYGDIGRAHGGTSWAEINRFAKGLATCCGGKVLESIVSYTGQQELGQQIAACAGQLPGDTWRGLARFDEDTLDSLLLIWEAYTRDANELLCEGFSQIFPEEMRTAVLGALTRNREAASYFADKDAQANLFAFMAGDAYADALQQGFQQHAAARTKRGEEWQELIVKLEKMYPGRVAQAKALGVHVTTLNSLLKGATAAHVHTETLQRARGLLGEATNANETASKATEAASLSTGQGAASCLLTAHERDPATYSITKMATRMNRPRQWLSRVLSGENAMPDNFAEMARQALPELFDPPVDTSGEAPEQSPQPEEHSGTAADAAEDETSQKQAPLVDDMPDSLIEATIGIGMSSIRNGVLGLESWQEAMPHGLSFSPKQRADMARYAARLIRLSGLTPAEASLAITGEPVTAEDLRGVFGAIQQEDRQKR